MSLGQHLLELRKRLMIAAVAIVVVSVGGWFISEWVLGVLTVPINQLSHGSDHLAKLTFTNATEPFDVRIQISLTVGLVVASPVWLYQIWAFIVPGLKRTERRYVIGFVGTAIPLFLAGAFVGWIIFPHMIELLGSFAPQSAASLFSASDYVNFATKLIIAVGVGFVMPVFLVLLNFIGVMSAKAILKGWRIAVIVIALFAATVTPSADVISMFILAVPMVVLYFGAAGVAWWHDRGVAKREAAFAAEIAV